MTVHDVDMEPICSKVNYLHSFSRDTSNHVRDMYTLLQSDARLAKSPLR